MAEDRKGSPTGYDLQYHIVWITKYRKEVLRGEMGISLRELIRQTSEALEVQIEKGPIASEQVHLLVSVPPQRAGSE